MGRLHCCTDEDWLSCGNNGWGDVCENIMLIKVAEEKAETFVKELKEKYYHNKGVTQVIRISKNVV